MEADDTVYLIPDDQLHLRDFNPNVMEPERYEALVRAVRKLGRLVQPLLVRKRSAGGFDVVDGYHRVKAGREAGLTVMSAKVEDLTDEEAKALQVGMNHARGRIDLGLASQVIQELRAEGLAKEDLVLLGFTDDELDDMIASATASATAVLEESDTTLPPEDEEEPDGTRPHTLELTFATKADYQKARRALRKAAGRGGELGDGLLRLLE